MNHSTSWAALVAALLAVACLGSTPPSRFYVLAPVDSAVAPEGAVAPSIRVAVVEVPQYLRGNAIVTRPGPNELELADLDRWGGSLDDDFARVLTTNLSRLVPSDRVVQHSWGHDQPFDASLFVDVRRFDAEPGRVVLEAQWTVLDGQDEALVTRVSEHERPIEGTDYAATVAAMSAALGDLSLDIAEAIRSL